MKRYWLLLSQAVTVALGIYLVLLAVRPDWAGSGPSRLQMGTPNAPVAMLQAPHQPALGSYREAAGRAMPAVVNILTSKALRKNHPLLKDPLFRKFFGDRDRREEQQS